MDLSKKKQVRVFLKKPKKVKTKSLAKLRKELWGWFSKFIRARDGGVCFTCGATGCVGSNYHAGHFIPQSVCNMDARFDDRFVRGQCFRCNINLSGNSVEFRKELVKCLEKGALEEYENSYKNPVKWGRVDFEVEIAHYKALVLGQNPA